MEIAAELTSIPVGIVDPFTEDGILNLLDEFVFLNVVCDGVRGHVEQEEVLLLRREDALLNQVLGQPLPHVLELVSQLQGVPRLPGQIFYPRLNCLSNVCFLKYYDIFFDDFPFPIKISFNLI